MIIAALKAAFSPSNILRTAAALIVVFAIANALNLTNALIQPIQWWKSRNATGG